MSAASPLAVAVLGLGAMGRPIATNLAAAGFPLVVWNRTASVADEVASDIGATAVPSPRAAAEQADVVIAMVRDDAASRAVWLDPEVGAVAGLREGAVAVEASTVTPTWVAELSHSVPAHASFLEAPVLGSRPQAAGQQLVSLVGGEPAVLERIRPVLAASSGRIEHVGPVGNGAAMKLVVNAALAGQVALFAELVAAIERSPLDDEQAVALLSSLPLTAPAVQRVLGLVTARNFSPNFPIELVAKDLGYMTAMLGERPSAGAPSVVRAAADTFAAAVGAGHGDLDISGVANLYL
jgi:3-hydroxyisobutyrate dehydrogenase